MARRGRPAGGGRACSTTALRPPRCVRLCHSRHCCRCLRYRRYLRHRAGATFGRLSRRGRRYGRQAFAATAARAATKDFHRQGHLGSGRRHACRGGRCSVAPRPYSSPATARTQRRYHREVALTEALTRAAHAGFSTPASFHRTACSRRDRSGGATVMRLGRVVRPSRQRRAG